MARSHSFLGFSFVRRGANELAHCLAKIPHEVGVNVAGIGVLPLVARRILHFEVPVR